MRLLSRVLVRLHAVKKPQYTLFTALVRPLRRLAGTAMMRRNDAWPRRTQRHAVHAVAAKAWRTEGSNAAGGTTACFLSLPLPPQGGQEGCSTRHGKQHA